MQQNQHSQSLSELLASLAGDIRTLIRQEANLAKIEMSQKATRVGRDAAYLAAGGAMVYAGFLALLVAIIALLALFIPLWSSALIVAVAGYFLIDAGRKALKRADLRPQETIETLKEDTQWLREQA